MYQRWANANASSPGRIAITYIAAMFGHSKNLPAAGTVIVANKGFAGRGFEATLTQLSLRLIRPARKDEPRRAFPGWLRQRIEAIIWTLNACALHCGSVPSWFLE